MKFNLFDWIEESSLDLGEKLFYDGSSNEQYRRDCQVFMYMIVSTLMWVLSGLTTSALFQNWLIYVCLVISFIPQRTCAGGFHLSYHYSCYITTTFITVIMALIGKLLINNYLLLFITAVISVLCIGWQVPKRSKNTLDYTQLEEQNFRRRYFRIILFITVVQIGLLFFIQKYNTYILKEIVSGLSCGMILASLMLMKWFEKFLKFIWREKEEVEEE